MESYKTLAQYYDDIFSRRQQHLKVVDEVIRLSSVEVKSVLELACGTWYVLEHLADRYEVQWIDNSIEMLDVARDKLPHIPLHKQDIVNFSLKDMFDCIISINDSVNHILSPNDLQKVFQNAFNHLKDDGIFYFDMITEKCLDFDCLRPLVVMPGNENIMLYKTKKRTKNQYVRQIKIYSNFWSDNKKVENEEIFEASYLWTDVLKWLYNAWFNKVFVRDIKVWWKPSDDSTILMFYCVKDSLII